MNYLTSTLFLPLLLFVMYCFPDLPARDNPNDPCVKDGSCGTATTTGDNGGGGTTVSLINYTQLTGSAGWSAREKFCSVVYNDRIWLIGGYSNETWYSFDGISWTLASKKSPDSAKRLHHRCVVFANKIWLLGGNSFSATYSDAWSTSDGINWVQATASAGWGGSAGRGNFGLVSFSNQLWVIGGRTNVAQNDVWSSLDGISWTQVTSNAAFSKREQHATFVFNNKLWVAGGCGDCSNFTGTYFNDVWMSSDGSSWSPVNIKASWEARSAMAFTVFNNQMFLLGGSRGTVVGYFKNDVWSSSDGISWTQQNNAAPWAARHFFEAVVFNNKLYLFGGRATSGVLNDVWRNN